MPIILAVLGALAAVYFFVIRARGAAEMTHELMDVANDVQAAARRFGFTRRRNQHPVDGIEDERLGIAALALAVLDVSAMPSRDELAALRVALATEFRVSGEEADEMLILGRWLVNQCSDAEAAVARISRKLCRSFGQDTLGPTMAVIERALQGAGGADARQQDALTDIRRAFGQR